MALFWFLLMIGPLVFFHELGHFVAARWFGVKCERFAVGVGPAVATFERWGTEFSVRALPLGGYVQLLGAAPEDEIDPDDQGSALTDKPVWQRMVIYLAGPVANVLLAIPLLWIYFAGDKLHQGAEVGTVLDGTPAAAAGFMPGDRIVSVGDREVRYFDDVVDVVSRSAGEPLTFVVDRGGATQRLVATPESVAGPGGRPMGMIGLVWSRYAAIVDVAPGSAAAAAGMKTFDRVVSVDGRDVTAWMDVAAALGGPEGSRQVVVERATPTGDAFAGLFVRERLALTLAGSGEAEARGLRSAEATVFFVEPMSPAAAAGLLPGDRIVEADGRPVTSVEMLSQRLLRESDRAHAVVVERGGARLTLTITPQTLEVAGEMRNLAPETFIGMFKVPYDRVPYELVAMPAGERVVYAVKRSFKETFALIAGFVIGLWMLVTGGLDSSNLGGPLMIAEVASRAGADGWLTFTRFMAVISVNLAVINLAPVPGLDGGNLVLLTAEGIRREPLSLRARNIAGYVGLACLVALMLFAFKNDIERNWVDIARWLNA